MIEVILILALMLYALVIFGKRASYIHGASIITGASAMFMLYEIPKLYNGSLIVSNSFVLNFLFWVIIISIPLILIGISAIFIVKGTELLKKEGYSKMHMLSLEFASAIILSLITIYTFGYIYSLNDSLSKYVYILSLIIYPLSYILVYFLIAMLSYNRNVRDGNLFKRIKNKIKNMVNLKSESSDYDYVIVLGAAIIGDQMTRIVARRVDKAIELLNLNPKSKLVTSGGQGPGEYLSEALAMKNYATFNKIDEKRILLEDKSTSTLENLTMSMEIISKDYYKDNPNKKKPKVAIATSDFHVFRTMYFADKLNIEAKGYGSKGRSFYSLNSLIREGLAFFVITWPVSVLSFITCIYFFYRLSVL